MPIPKVIYQTYKTQKLPWLFNWHISQMRKRNPEYEYEFYDDQRIEAFLQESFDKEIFQLYKRINHGAAKADFFRYAVLLNKGGVYLDIDSRMINKIDDFVRPDDTAVISLESNLERYVQWALIFEANHPIMQTTFNLVVDNLKNNRYPYDVLRMTGPIAFTNGINNCLSNHSSVAYRKLGIDYDGNIEFSFPMSKTALYGVLRKGHWKKEKVPVLKDGN